MKSHLLKLTPKKFCRETDACSDGVRFAPKHATMREVWTNCPRVDWLCWIANVLDLPPDEKALRLYMVWCARNTPLADGRTTGALLTHPDSLAALKVAERFARGQATADQLSVTYCAAYRAAESAAYRATYSAAYRAAESAARRAARSAAWSAAESAAWSAAESAAWSAAESAAWSTAYRAAESAAESTAWSAAYRAAESAARSTAYRAAESAARSAQADEFRRIVPNPF